MSSKNKPVQKRTPAQIVAQFPKNPHEFQSKRVYRCYLDFLSTEEEVDLIRRLADLGWSWASASRYGINFQWTKRAITYATLDKQKGECRAITPVQAKLKPISLTKAKHILVRLGYRLA